MCIQPVVEFSVLLHFWINLIILYFFFIKWLDRDRVDKKQVQTFNADNLMYVTYASAHAFISTAKLTDRPKALVPLCNV